MITFFTRNVYPRYHARYIGSPAKLFKGSSSGQLEVCTTKRGKQAASRLFEQAVLHSRIMASTPPFSEPETAFSPGSMGYHKWLELETAP